MALVAFVDGCGVVAPAWLVDDVAFECGDGLAEQAARTINATTTMRTWPVYRAPVDAREARRLVLSAQGFGTTASPVRPVIARLHQFQLDPISVVQRAQYMPLYSRLGPYDVAGFDRLVYERRAMWEYIGHEAALLSIDLYPLMRWRMSAFMQSRRWIDWMPDGFVQRVLDDIHERGPLAIGDLTDPGIRPPTTVGGGREQGAMRCAGSPPPGRSR